MEMVILGAGGLGREVRDVIVALNDVHHPTQNDPKDGSAAGTTDVKFLGFIADGQPDVELLERLPAAHLGGLDELHRFTGAGFVAAVGDPGLRMHMARAAMEAGLRPTTLIHPTATIGADVHIGAGSMICAGVRITTNVQIGRHVVANLNCTIGHDAVLEDYVTLNPLVSISGNVHLERGATVGTNATVIQRLRVGSDAVVGAGAAVVRDVEPATTVVGVPARPLGARGA